uniref:Testis expressed 26 n=1 Tax=Rousettus aegyptiacus TaxID=9407 RepID=A0A7J8DZS7_ROUAE|nr:testis expressed 26 [Rousettus aegyptiacus]
MAQPGPEAERPWRTRPGDTRWDSYATTTKTAFPPKAGTMPPLTRPKSTRRLGYTYFLNDPIFNQTHYNDEFTWKSYPKDLIQARTSRTLGSHKSHISQDLFHWTLPPGHEVSQKIYLLRKSAASAAGEVRKALANQFVSHTKRDFVDKAEGIFLVQLQMLLEPPNRFSWSSPRGAHEEADYVPERLRQGPPGFPRSLKSPLPSRVTAYPQSISQEDRRILDHFVRSDAFFFKLRNKCSLQNTVS